MAIGPTVQEALSFDELTALIAYHQLREDDAAKDRNYQLASIHQDRASELVTKQQQVAK